MSFFKDFFEFCGFAQTNVDEHDVQSRFKHVPAVLSPVHSARRDPSLEQMMSSLPAVIQHESPKQKARFLVCVLVSLFLLIYNFIPFQKHFLFILYPESMFETSCTKEARAPISLTTAIPACQLIHQKSEKLLELLQQSFARRSSIIQKIRTIHKRNGLWRTRR